MLRVQQLMTQNVSTCHPDDSLEHAARLMWEEDVGAIPVVDNSKTVVAMLTDRDVCMGALTTGRSISQIQVREAMSSALFSTHPQDPIDTAEILMKEQQVRRLPVVDQQGGLKGILSQNDLIREASRERERRRKDLSAVEVTSTLASIGRSRVGELSTVRAM